MFGGFIWDNFLEPWTACLKFKGFDYSGISLHWLGFSKTKVETVVFWVYWEDKEPCYSFLEDDPWIWSSIENKGI